MFDWNDIKAAFEKDARKAEEAHATNEQNLLKAIANHICTQKGTTAVQGYNPEEVISFLEQPLTAIKSSLGGEWSDMNDEKLETLIYTLVKKVKKSGNMIEW